MNFVTIVIPVLKYNITPCNVIFAQRAFVFKCITHRRCHINSENNKKNNKIVGVKFNTMKGLSEFYLS